VPAVGSFEQSLKIIFLIKLILTALLLTADHCQWLAVEQYSSTAVHTIGIFRPHAP